MEKTTFVDQRLATVQKLLASRPALFARQGAVVATWRTVGQRRSGPYYALRYRDSRRQQSLYLGFSSLLAEQVGLLLKQAQRPRRQQCELRNARAATRDALRRHKCLWQRDLERAGLTLKGFEIRRWKGLQTDADQSSAVAHHGQRGVAGRTHAKTDDSKAKE